MPTASAQYDTLLDQAESMLAMPHRTLEQCAELLKHTREELGERQFCRAHYLSGYANRIIGELTHAESELFFAKQLATAIDDKQLVALSSLQLGLVYVDEQKNDRAIELLQFAEAQFAALGMQIEEARACFALSNVYQQNKQCSEAVRNLEQALIKFSNAGSQAGVAAVHCALMHVSMDQGKYQEAIERAERCAKVMPDSPRSKNRIYLNLALGECYRKLGQIERALDIINSAVEMASMQGFYLVEARGLLLQHFALKELGESEGSQFSLEKAEELSILHGFESTLEALKNEIELA